jgi:putative membrane-bound dehydrogenase-like protein
MVVPGFSLHITLQAALLLGAAPLVATAAEPVQPPDRPRSLASELPRIPATEPKRAVATFSLQHGFQLELVASEPLVADPVDACFDAHGRLYVAQMHGYPFSQEPTRLNPKGGGKTDAGVVKRLEDTDGDGTFDRSVTFAQGIRWPTSVCCYNGGIFVLAPPTLHYFKDTNNDGRADLHQVVFTGFGRDNVQSVANNLKWGLDNRITLAAGRNPGQLTHNNKPVLTLGGKDFSFDPRTLDVQALTGGVQFGNSFDAWGNRFVCSNSNHIQHVVLPRRYLSRHPGLSPPASIRSIAALGAAAPVYRRSRAEPWRIVRTRRRVSDPKTKARLPRTEQFAIGFFTSATSVTIYTGDAYPDAFRGNAFIGDVGGNLVHRKTITPKGPSFVARRADQKVEFIASTDNWFRPVNFVNAPDGTLYVIDMYRETIEHPYSIPEDIKKHLRLESGDNRGRIYRLVPPDWERPEPLKLAAATSQQLIESLESDNGWTRMTAHRLLWERRDRKAVPALVETAGHSELALARAHSLWILDGMGELPDSLLATALADASPRVREHAIVLAEERLDRALYQPLVERLARDPDPRVRYQLAFSLGGLDATRRRRPLSHLARRSPSDSHLRFAVMSSSLGLEAQLLAELLQDKDFLATSVAANWLADCARLAGGNPQSAEAVSVLRLVLQGNQPPARQAQLLTALGNGLARRGQSVSAVLAHKTTPATIRAAAQAAFRNAASQVTDDKAPAAARVSSTRLLGFAPTNQAVPVLASRLVPSQPPALQQAAVASLGRHPEKGTWLALLQRWKGHSPRLRADIADLLVQRPASAHLLLDAVAAGRVLPTDLTLEKRQLLVNNRDPKLRDRSAKLLASTTAPDRAKVIARYTPALEKPGDVKAGAAVFKKLCAACHKVGTLGHTLGPDLKSVSNKSPRDLLINILDPNREAQPNFVTYTLVTIKGRVLTGIVAAETANTVTLKRAEGKQDIVARSQIEILVSNGKSLMPEGLEKELTPEALQDVVAWIRSLKPNTK